MKKYFLLTVALLGCTVAPVETPEAKPVSGLDPQLCIDNSGDPTMVVDREFSMTGHVLSEVGEAPFSGETVEYASLVVANDDNSDFNYFYVGAGKIDKAVDGQLYLKLGVLDEGVLSSTATISAEDSTGILATLNSDEDVTLNMLSASTLGQGAAVNSVNPCLIQLPE